MTAAIPLDNNGAPDLQLLVRATGGYQAITPELWAAFDQAMARYQSDFQRRGLAPYFR
jgi:hypothetical protein